MRSLASLGLKIGKIEDVTPILTYSTIERLGYERKKIVKIKNS